MSLLTARIIAFQNIRYCLPLPKSGDQAVDSKFSEIISSLEWMNWVKIRYLNVRLSHPEPHKKAIIEEKLDRLHTIFLTELEENFTTKQVSLIYSYLTFYQTSFVKENKEITFLIDRKINSMMKKFLETFWPRFLDIDYYSGTFADREVVKQALLYEEFDQKELENSEELIYPYLILRSVVKGQIALTEVWDFLTSDRINPRTRNALSKINQIITIDGLTREKIEKFTSYCKKIGSLRPLSNWQDRTMIFIGVEEEGNLLRTIHHALKVSGWDDYIYH